MTTSNLDKNVIYGLYCLCHPTEIRYVGQTSRGAEERLTNHLATVKHRETRGMRLAHSQNWMRKHGLDNIAVCVLEVCASPEELDEAEIRWVRFFENLTNIKDGGTAARGWKMPEGMNAGERNPMFGKDRSELMDRIRKLRGPMSEENKRERALRLEECRKDPEWNRRRIEALRQAKRTPEARKAASERVSGERNPNWGRVPSKEERIKNAKARASLSEEQVREIRHRVTSGEMHKDVAARFNISPSSVSGIVSRRRYAWVD